MAVGKRGRAGPFLRDAPGLPLILTPTRIRPPWAGSSFSPRAGARIRFRTPPTGIRSREPSIWKRSLATARARSESRTSAPRCEVGPRPSTSPTASGRGSSRGVRLKGRHRAVDEYGRAPELDDIPVVASYHRVHVKHHRSASTRIARYSGSVLRHALPRAGLACGSAGTCNTSIRRRHERHRSARFRRGGPARRG